MPLQCGPLNDTASCRATTVTTTTREISVPRSTHTYEGFALSYRVRTRDGEPVGGNVNAMSDVLFPQRDPMSAGTPAIHANALRLRRNAELQAQSYANQHCCEVVVEEVWQPLTKCWTHAPQAHRPQRPTPTELARAKTVSVGAEERRIVATRRGTSSPSETRVWFEVVDTNRRVLERFEPVAMSANPYRLANGRTEHRMMPFTFNGEPSAAQARGIVDAEKRALAWVRARKDCGCYRVLRREVTTSGCAG